MRKQVVQNVIYNLLENTCKSETYIVEYNWNRCCSLLKLGYYRLYLQSGQTYAFTVPAREAVLF